MQYERLDDFLLDLPQLVQGEKEKLAAVDGLFCLKTESRILWVRLQGGQVELLETCTDRPDCTVEAKEQLLLDLLCGRANLVKVILTGKVHIRGDKAKLMKLVSLAAH